MVVGQFVYDFYGQFFSGIANILQAMVSSLNAFAYIKIIQTYSSRLSGLEQFLAYVCILLMLCMFIYFLWILYHYGMKKVMMLYQLKKEIRQLTQENQMLHEYKNMIACPKPEE